MHKLISLVALFFFFTGLNAQQSFKGFFEFIYTDDGKVLLQIPKDKIDQEFLYVNSLSTGIGSNDLGLDRGQLGKTRIVKFVKAGNKILLVEPNFKYRALSDNLLERKAIEEAFAQSILFGFEVKDNLSSGYEIDISLFLMRDSHGIAKRLKEANQGSFKLDKSRCAIWLDRTKSFPKNSEFEAILTFQGDGEGDWLKSVAPDAAAVTVRVHHSFILLPDDGFTPRIFHPYSGFNAVSFFDYATPIESPITKRYIRKHRLIKKNPGAAISEVVEPIIYYIDPGCPEPIKSALMNGAGWWDQAFQAAGFAPNTFQIKELPAGADMLDVRYNVIQWIHRSTRGWSYGSTVTDPRTGEIIKGHVSLGSLRVRQDFLIAQGIYSPYGILDNPDEELKMMALARLRQLGAHEVGHTLGLAHNFASSVNNRASVMDYPHPSFELSEEGISKTNVYDNKIGNWDKKTISYGYAEFDPKSNEEAELRKMISLSQKEGYLYMSDRDARPQGGAHPLAHLWDNGADPVAELMRLLDVRKDALSRFGISSIKDQTPLSELENVLVPLYLMHRYQAEAVVKMIGGLYYHYNVKGDEYDDEIKLVDPEQQGAAVDALLVSLTPEQLKLPTAIIKMIHPTIMGYQKSRETFSGRSSIMFDPLAPAEGYVNSTLAMMLNKDRLARIYRQNVSLGSPIELKGYLSMLGSEIFDMTSITNEETALIEIVQKSFVIHMLKIAFDKKVDPQASAISYGILKELETSYLNEMLGSKQKKYHALYLKRRIKSAEEGTEDFSLPELKTMPPGSPIGCGMFH